MASRLDSNNTCLTGALPIALSNINSCSLGFFCPNNTDQVPPQYCPPTPECEIIRLETLWNTCQQSQGPNVPMICESGYYCPHGSRRQILCPSGYYCPLGSFKPIQCDAISSCRPGSSRQFPFLGIFLVIIIDIVLVVIVSLGSSVRKNNRTVRQRLTLASSEKLGMIMGNTVYEQLDELEARDTNVNFEPHHASIQNFVGSLKQCLGTSALRFEIGFDYLGLRLKSGKTILQGVSGKVEPGSMLAVMGPSGAGKSTFVRLFMGKLKNTSGTTYVNGDARGMSEFKKIIAYIPQDDVVLSELTVRENILHSARIRLPRSWAEKEIERYVDDLLSCLGLSHIQNSLVGDSVKPVISGGQRKRVSIGIELAAALLALVLDEPTSGLDATSALSIIGLLKALCRLGITVICILHQPRVEIFQSLDRLLLLANGQELYFARAVDAIEYFENAGFSIPKQCNPADVLMYIISGQGERYVKPGWRKSQMTIPSLINRWNLHRNRKIQFSRHGAEERLTLLDTLSKSAAARGASWHRQMCYCFLRSVRQQTRQLSGFLLEIVVGAVAGLLIGLSVYRIDGLLFQGIFLPPFQLLSSATNYMLVPQLGLLSCLAIGLAAAAPGVRIFGEEKSVYWREAGSGHSRSAYFLGKTLSTLFRLTFSSLHFTSFYSILATPRMPFSILLIFNTLYFYCIYSLASCVSVTTRRENGPLMAVIVSLIIGVFGGYGSPLSTIKTWHLEWLWRLCPGLSEAYFHCHTVPLKYLYDIDSAAAWTGYTVNQLELDISMLLIIGTFYRLLAFTGLVYTNRDKQV
ncbi:hypothetical protein sscle_13g093620 [Sclerotinia sclerotiorum 1980 UF-70]|uniref:ABC transporter domain-containing protein n=1 Tax=Sclerotinia sclerotiorum (strain ATCC 18683 / 1980 / Ss-1) TaxID=665079 RepID=A0A1D9QIG7_SCLS1|nr:hypothetical protein sscle_13g093620 [Sclerotinia sclerotiorum 1980 UF-70]